MNAHDIGPVRAWRWSPVANTRKHTTAPIDGIVLEVDRNSYGWSASVLRGELTLAFAAVCENERKAFEWAEWSANTILAATPGTPEERRATLGMLGLL